MQITAAVVHEKSGPFVIDTFELCEPRPDEVIVRVVASGMCQTDLHGRDGYYLSPYPTVYGHEGAGVVHAVGSAVRALAPGDHVVMSYPWCGACANCRQQRHELLLERPQPEAQRNPRRRFDAAWRRTVRRFTARIFSNPSFGTLRITQERYAVKVRKDAPLELLARSRAAARPVRARCSMREAERR